MHKGDQESDIHSFIHLFIYSFIFICCISNVLVCACCGKAHKTSSALRWLNVQRFNHMEIFFLINILTFFPHIAYRYCIITFQFVFKSPQNFGQCMVFYTSPSHSPKKEWIYLSQDDTIAAIQLLFVASELKDPICHSNECQIGSFSSEATIFRLD